MSDIAQGPNGLHTDLIRPLFEHEIKPEIFRCRFLFDLILNKK